MNVEEILQLKRDLSEYYQGLHKQFQDQWDLYSGNIKFPETTPVEVNKHIPPTAHSIIDSATNAIMSLAYKFSSPPHKDTRQAEAESENRTAFLNKFVSANERMQDVSVIRDVSKHTALYGMGVFKGPSFMAEEWADEPTRLKGESEGDFDDRRDRWIAMRRMSCPLKLTAVEPSTILFDPSPDPKYAIETYDRKLITIKQAYPHWKPDGVAKDFEDVTWIEYSDREQRVCMVASAQNSSDAQIVPMLSWKSIEAVRKNSKFKDWDWESGIIPNIYEYLPYTRIFSGVGTATPGGKPEDRAIGLLHPAISSLIAEAQLQTAVDYQIVMNAYRPLILYTPEGYDSSKVKIEYGPSKLVTIPLPKSEVNLEPMIPYTMGTETFKHLSDLKAEIDQGTIARALTGVKTPGIYTGYHEAIYVGQAQKALQPIINSVLIGLSKVGQKALFALENVVKGEVFGCTPRDIKGMYYCEAYVDTMTPEERDRRIQLGIALAGNLSWDTRAKDYLGVPEPKKEWVKMQSERLVQSGLADPALLQMIYEYLGVMGAGQSAQATMNGQPQPPPPLQNPQSAGATSQEQIPNMQHPTPQAPGQQSASEQYMPKNQRAMPPGMSSGLGSPTENMNVPPVRGFPND